MKKKVITAFLSAIMVLVMGTAVFASSGSWQYDGHGWWYAYDQGGYAASRWEDIDGSWYHFNYNGYMDTGWIYDGAWYYLNPDGSMATGWIYDSAWYYMDPSSGAMATGWINDGNNWYYMNANGTLYTGWLWDGAWYYMYPGGAMATGWMYDGCAWYYMGESGAMQTGWINDGTDWYYANASGVMQTGWFWDGAWYYLYPSGIMATGWVYDKCNKYYFDETTGIMVRGEVDIDGEIHTTTPSINMENVSTAVSKAAKAKLNEIGWDLYSAFKWSAGTLYDIHITGPTVAAAALSIFQNGAGDSVAKASAFCLMARQLGYDAYVIIGWVPSSGGGYREHAWVEIHVGGSIYVCDPVFETQTGTNGYMFNYGQSGTWQYINNRNFPE